MSFIDIDNEIKGFYTSTHDDLVEDFYNPVLSHTIKYDRLSGFFSSTSLACAARGISNLIRNNGKMRLLCGAQLDERDLIAIENANDLKDIVNKNFLGEYENLENQFVKNHVLLLGWMIANDFLEIKIGINTNGEEYKPDGMLHMKRGIFYDENNDCVMFIGSVNETCYGWTKNLEEFRVDKSWIYPDAIEGPVKNFEELWDGEVPELLVFDIPNESKDILIKNAPKTKFEVQKIIDEIENIKRKPKDNRELFPYQIEAIKNWLDNDKRGILEMATGTGKTFTALKCLEEIVKKEDVLVVISCPYSHIIDQWEKDIYNLDLGRVYKFYGGANSNWREDFQQLKLNINLKIDFDKPNIILTTHNTFSTKNFVNIVDEAHHVGAKGFGKGLSSKYEYRLGLSATPSRYMDYEGTDVLIDYFNGIVFKFNIVEALSTINPITKKTFLTPYDYLPQKVTLNESELEDYKKLNKKIARLYHNKSSDDEENPNLQGLYSKRRAIVNNANQKYVVFRDILRKLPHKNHLIVFCSNKQLKEVLKILNEEGISPSHKFTQKEGKTPSKDYGGLSQRQDLLKDFDDGICKSLVAIKCLDEGVDVPSADQVIIMSSTTNPSEYIQRRGRVLRRFKDKNKAYIYDLCVIPDEDAGYDKIMENEKKRLIEFTKTASPESKSNCIYLFKMWGIL